MTNLLDLPRELRDEILGLVLCSHPEAYPTCDGVSQKRHDSNPIFHASSLDIPESQSIKQLGSVKYLPVSSALFLTNRQMHEETKYALLRLPAGGLEYELDIEVRQDEAFHLEWMSIPRLARRVDRLRINMRTTGLLPPTANAQVSARTDSRVGAVLVWLCFDLLESLVITNLCHQSKDGEDVPVVTLKHLEINFVTPEECHLATPLDTSAAHHQYVAHAVQRSSGDSELRILRANWLYTQVHNNVAGSFNDWSRYWEGFKWQTIILERVGNIWLKMDGVLKSKADLSQTLARMSKANWVRNNQMQVWDGFRELQLWKDNTSTRRQANGLQVGRRSSLRNMLLANT
ncbi:hypothetical protein K504DRAFT_504373 [Pleomassaria siparia CBS 279.74]|uniref:F-box domain-containing protein n=1 Tax=Pleomassaria siparia CBS 279.74 TaxID=1314801 RepID=A0A6G1K492_9PLEO|nr:hypothetical protein K504DRAFT_504373 [Pleomassaria siparia CBS 279.74]